MFRYYSEVRLNSEALDIIQSMSGKVSGLVEQLCLFGFSLPFSFFTALVSRNVQC